MSPRVHFLSASRQSPYHIARRTLAFFVRTIQPFPPFGLFFPEPSGLPIAYLEIPNPTTVNHSVRPVHTLLDPCTFLFLSTTTFLALGLLVNLIGRNRATDHCPPQLNPKLRIYPSSICAHHPCIVLLASPKCVSNVPPCRHVGKRQPAKIEGSRLLRMGWVLYLHQSTKTPQIINLAGGNAIGTRPDPRSSLGQLKLDIGAARSRAKKP